VHPVLTAEAAGYISERYAALRSKETDSKSLPVTARTLECMIRLSTAYAKSRLSENVEKEDAEHALQLVNFAYYNEAEKKTREEESDDDDDDEDPNDDDGDAGASQRTAPRTPKTPKTPKSAAKSPKTSASAVLPPSTSKPAAKGKGKGKGKSVYDFDEDGPDAGEEEGAPTDQSPRAKRAAKKSPAKAAKEPEPEPEPIETTPEQQKIVRTALQAVFKAADGDSTTVGDLAAEINRTNPGVLNANEVDVVLEMMAEENAIMKVDEQIILI
jgi:DNA replication licensing factor MCM3